MSKLEQLLGPTLTNKKNETIPTSSLSKDYVGIYFSAHWCPPCRGFTPQLASFYSEGLKDKLEIVFVSSDKDQKSFDEYLGEMPWLALPFADRDRKGSLSSKFKVQGIPTFVILDKDGNLMTDKGRAKVMEDPKGTNLPWKPKTLLETLGQTVQGKDGVVDISKVLQNDLVGIYFSAHWCGPCRNFTPKFADTYKKVKADGKKFEVIFVSSDNDKEAFDEYYKDMPWLALPFGDPRANELSDIFNVEGIPHLAFFDPKTGKVTNNNGRGSIAKDPTGANFPWLPPALKNLDGDVVDDLNNTACFIVFAENATDDVANATKSAMEQLAKEYVAKFDAAGGDHPIIFVHADKTNSDLGERVREFLNLDAKETFAVVMNLPEGKKHVSKDVSDGKLKQLVADFLDNKLAFVGMKQ